MISSYVLADMDDLCELAKKDLLKASKDHKIYTVNPDYDSFTPIQKALLLPYFDNETIEVKKITSDELPKVLQLSQKYGAGLMIKNYAKIYWASFSNSILITDDKAIIKVCNYCSLATNTIEWYINMVIDNKLKLNLKGINVKRE